MTHYLSDGWLHPYDEGYPHEELMNDNETRVNGQRVRSDGTVEDFIGERRVNMTFAHLEDIIEDAKAEGRAEITGGPLGSLALIGIGLALGVFIGILLPF